MKKSVGLILLIFLSVIQINCGVEINGRDVVPYNDQREEICDIKMVFHKQWDAEFGDYYWTSVELENTLDQRLRLFLFQYDGDILLATELTPFQYKTHALRIEEGTDVYINVENFWNDDICGQGKIIEL